MMKRIDVVLIVILLGIGMAVVTISQLVGRYTDTSFMSWAQRPVGNRPAPVQVMQVEAVELTEVGTLTLDQARRSISSFLGGRNIRAQYPLQEYDLVWHVSVEDGSLAPVEADVFVPQGSRDQVFPVIVYGPGSTGLDDRCAPSREDLRIGNMGNYRNQMIAQASQGYIVVMPNYEGLDNPNRTQNYFNKDAEARTLLSSARALYTAAESTRVPIQQRALFFGGYSQGGHAAFSAADYARRFAPGLEVTGVFGHGPTTDTMELLRSNPNLAAYFVSSYSEYYPVFDPHVVLEDAWVAQLENARTLCVNEAFGTNSTTVSQVFEDRFEVALVNGTLAQDFPALYEVLVENNAGTSFTGIPALVVHGLADPIVTTPAQDVFVEQMCGRGVSVTYQRYRGLHHFSTRQTSFRDTNAWIDSLSRGETPRNDCVEFDE